MSQSRLFAVIPAAGHSRRMGRPKLLLPIGNDTVLGHLLQALSHPAIAARVVVARRADAALAAEARACGADVVQPDEDPPDMLTSVEHALRFLRERFDPDPNDGWMLVPADHPTLDAQVISGLVAHWNSGHSSILIPTHGGRRGHPAFFRWSLATAVPSIPADRGLNWLVESHAGEVEELAVDSPAVLTDLDTPADYERLLRNSPSGS